jgi:hypothetical protein
MVTILTFPVALISLLLAVPTAPTADRLALAEKAGQSGSPAREGAIHAGGRGPHLETAGLSGAAAGDSPATLLLSAEALVLPPESGSTTLTATLRDARGEPVPAAVVLFESDAGAVAPESTTTDVAGVATATFTAGATRGQVIVAARAGSLTQTVVLQIQAPAQAETDRRLELAVAADVLQAGATVAVTATLRGMNGDAIGGAPVSFFGAPGQVAPASAVTDPAGKATASFTAGNAAGRARLTALAGYASAMITVEVSTSSGPGDHWVRLPLVLKRAGTRPAPTARR